MRDAEVTDFDIVFFGNEDIRRFDIAVDDALFVCVIKRLCTLLSCSACATLIATSRSIYGSWPK